MTTPIPLRPQEPAQGQDPLAQLQDIHLPDAISYWPPAWGWWLVAVVSISTISIGIFLWRRYKVRNLYRLQAIHELEQVQEKYTAEQNAEYLQALNIILRRSALSGLGKNFNTSLKGEDWLTWLDNQVKKSDKIFSEGVGRALLIGPYQKNPEFNRIELHAAAINWIKQHRNQWQRSTKSNNNALLQPKQEAA